ncbi:hypothetical protein ACOME3_004953 [Neoechinorhynchus agilis]
MRLTIVLFIANVTRRSVESPACDVPFYGDREILLQLGKSRVFPDSKSIVDLVMKDDWNNFGEQFKRELKQAGKDINAIASLISKYFNDPGTELEEITPSDWVQDVKIFDEEISSDRYRQFAFHLNNLWRKLYRRQVPGINLNRTSFIKMEYPNIVPGGRFREIYYWDSYWTAKGALVCGMTTTVQHMIRNLADNIKQFGLVPNGGRVYYSRRSQPPVLTLMVADYYDVTKDLHFVKEMVSYLDQEYKFWLKNRSIKINARDDDGIQLFQFRTNTTEERPEAFIEDYNTANDAKRLMNRSRDQVFIDITSAAESGWDFSSIHGFLTYSGPHAFKMYSIRTTKIVPVCLNSILYLVARKLSAFHRMLGRMNKASYYDRQQRMIKRGIHRYLWDASDHQWYDYDLEHKSSHKNSYASNYFPLWAKAHDLPRSDLRKVVKSMIDFEFLKYQGGFITSTTPSGQQWDMPNAWAPIQDIMIEGLLNTGWANATRLALDLASRWLHNNRETLNQENAMFEKYSAARIGYPGEGGEYDVQTGFGWTNGVALKYLLKYGPSLRVPDPTAGYRAASIILGFVTIALIGLIIWLAYGLDKARKRETGSS